MTHEPDLATLDGHRQSRPLFSSSRERHVWFCALAAALAVFSTLFWGRILAGILGEGGLLGLSFALGMLLVGATILAHGLKVRPSSAEVGVTLGILATFWLLFVRLASPAERTHLIEYGAVSVLIHAALVERVAHGHHVPTPALIAVVATTLLGVFDECI